MDRSRPRHGFGLLFVVMLIAVIASVLALAYPKLMHYEKVKRVSRTAQMLDELKMATAVFPQTPSPFPEFRHRIGMNLGELSQLTNPITGNNANISANACGTKFKNTDDDAWRFYGPFFSRDILPGVGFNTPMGVVNDAIIYTTGGPDGRWIIATITTADLTEIELLDEMVDGVDPAAAGAGLGLIDWDSISGGTARLRYRINTDNSC